MTRNDFMPDDAFIAGIKARDRRITKRSAAADQSAVRGAFRFSSACCLSLVAGAWPLLQQLCRPQRAVALGAARVSLCHRLRRRRSCCSYRATKPTRSSAVLTRPILPMVFGFIKDLNYRHDVTPQSFDRMPRETVGAFNRESFDDVISGRCEEFAFELYEATLRDKSSVRTSSRSRGSSSAFETMTPFPGVLVATRKTGSRSASCAAYSAAGWRSCRAACRRWTKPTSFAPTMSTRRGRW